MKIEILESGCTSCRSLEQNVREALERSGIEAEVEVVEDLQRIMAYGVMRTPGLVVDGKLLSVGKNLTPDEISQMIG
jgi:small redox-active disulfide protein 2